jgi:hypothetical protein
MTGLDPDLRFDNHKAGIQANQFVKSYGVRLLPNVGGNRRAEGASG